MSAQSQADTPDREALIQALLALGTHTHARRLRLDDLQHEDEHVLEGMLLAAAEQLADRSRKGVGPGRSRGHECVRGYMKYLVSDDLTWFFRERDRRQLADSDTYRSLAGIMRL